MDSNEIWPLYMGNAEVRDQMVRRQKSARREWRWAMIWTGWNLAWMIFDGFMAARSPDTWSKIAATFAAALFGFLIFSTANKWEKAQRQEDAAASAIAAWDDLLAQNNPRKEMIRNHMVENAIQLSAAIMTEQHLLEELKAAKKRGSKK